MKKWFSNLKVSQKLALISIFFLIPDSVLLLLFLTTINENIRFAQWEMYGNEYQRPLEELLEYLPLHSSLTRQPGGGEQQSKLSSMQSQIDQSFEALAAVDARLGVKLQFTEEGLAKRKRGHCRVQTLQQEWQSLKTGWTRLPPETCAQQHAHLVADVRTMITHVGDTSNLILDPDLDSYYLMDATLLALPQMQARLTSMTLLGEAAFMRGQMNTRDHRQLSVATAMLKEADLDRVTGSLQTALNEDANFYGTSETLQRAVPPALKLFTTNVNTFIQVANRLSEGHGNQTALKDFVAAGTTARQASFSLWRVANTELDVLLQKRIQHYRSRRARSLLLSAMALVAAVSFVAFITRSISGPLKRQAERLQEANQTLQAEVRERQRAEEAMRIAEARYRGIFENSVEGIFQTTLDGRYIIANPTLARMYGYESVDELQAGISDIQRKLYVDSNRRSEFERLMAEAGEVRGFESQVYRKDGSIIWVTENARVVRDATGAVLYYEGTVENINQRKQADEARQRMEIQLRHAQKMESIGQLAAGIAHEINTPTQFIGDNTRFLRDAFTDLQKLLEAQVRLMAAAQAGSVPDSLLAEVETATKSADMDYLSEEIPKALGQSLDGIERVTNIVRAMKDFSHPGTTEKTALDFNRAIESTLTICSNEWKYVADLVSNFDTSLPPVPVLPGEFNQVVLNIIINATHAIADVVGDGANGKGRITVSTRRDGEWVEVRIGDTGTGIPERARPKVFDPFFTTKSVGKGTGQGLAIAHSVVAEKHGGTIHFETETGKGTTFIIRLPLISQPAGIERKAA